MSFKVSAKLSGGKDLAARLKVLEGKVREKAAKQAADAAGKIILAEARNLVPYELGILKSSLGKKTVLYPSGVGVCVIGPRHGFRQRAIRRKNKWAPAAPPPSGYANPVNYTHLVELGTFRSKAYAFLRPALDTKAQEAIEAAHRVLDQIVGGA